MLEADARLLADVIQRRFPKPDLPNDFVWTAAPPVRVIDCVLSLNRPYNSVVEPRVRAFAKAWPGITTCEKMLERIRTSASPAAFLQETLDMRDARRAATLLGVVEHLIDAQSRFEGVDEEERLRRYAAWARPGDYLAVGVGGFGLAGFQYLRMLFGAETTKPDVHIVGFVRRELGREVSDVHALYVLERAAELSGVSIRSLDVAIWKSAAR